MITQDVSATLQIPLSFRRVVLPLSIDLHIDLFLVRPNRAPVVSLLTRLKKRASKVSQWKVNSSSASQLMIIFYDSRRADQSGAVGQKAEALQVAAQRLMKDQRFKHPFYWAGFILIGIN